MWSRGSHQPCLSALEGTVVQSHIPARRRVRGRVVKRSPAGADCVATGKSHTASSGTALSAIYQAVLKVRSSAEVTRSPDGVTQSPHAPLAGAKRNQLVSAPTDSEIRGYCVTQWHKSSPRSKTTRRELVCVKRCSC